MTPLPFTPGDGEMCLSIRDLEIDVPIGILEHEKRRPQRVRFNIAAIVADSGRHESTDVADYVSYAEVIGKIKALAASGRHIPLVENLAEEVAGLVLEDARVLRVVVDIQKPDIIPEAGGVGVTIQRRRSRPGTASGP